MNERTIPSVDITIGANMYGRISDITNTPSHVLAEFVDNAIQSYKDNKDKLLSLNPNYKLRIVINFEWNADDNKRASKVTIEDNAAGINSNKFSEAFKLAQTPDDNTGLNEFGMGMKTAALWLGEIWSVKTSALDEDVAREITFNLNDVLKEELKTLPVKQTNEIKTEHYTLLTISAPTRNIPAQRSLNTIKEELASIYRKYLRNDEIDIIVNNDKLIFEDPSILTAAFHKKPGEPEGNPVKWKKDIDFRFGKYRAKGFIALLNKINQTQNGLALLRRGRVVVGAETDGRYFPKSLFGSVGNFRYKRLFGELELEGFDVAFNKNDIQDRENLEILMEALKSEIHSKSFDLYTQADNYREDERTKQIKKLVRAHNTAKKEDRKVVIYKPLEIFTPSTLVNEDRTEKTEGVVIDAYDEDVYEYNGVQYSVLVSFIDSGKDLVWLQLDNDNPNKIICKINSHHDFFNHFKLDKSIIALLKTMTISRFISHIQGNDSAGEMLEYFNQLILKTKI